MIVYMVMMEGSPLDFFLEEQQAIDYCDIDADLYENDRNKYSVVAYKPVE